jgi:hypothetical protein
MSLPKPEPKFSLSDVKGRPVGMGLPVFVERRNLLKREALIRRIAAEFDEMPGLALSIKQASRFLGLSEDACARVLASLTRSGSLRRNADNLYVRRDRSA